jgi:hypothetical protein
MVPSYRPPPKPVVLAFWRVERVFGDGRRELVTLGGEPWEGAEEQALERARVMQAEETDVKFELLSVVRTQLGRPASE